VRLKCNVSVHLGPRAPSTYLKLLALGLRLGFGSRLLRSHGVVRLKPLLSLPLGQLAAAILLLQEQEEQA
jgi:hypothetical protein